MELSEDQAAAFDEVGTALKAAGVDLVAETAEPADEARASQVMALLGRAGSGKTMLLAALIKELEAAGVETVSADYETRKKADRRTVAILTPTNKAASVLRRRGVPATTIHRILYTPVYTPDYQKLADWLLGEAERPRVEDLEMEGLTKEALDKAAAFY